MMSSLFQFLFIFLFRNILIKNDFTYWACARPSKPLIPCSLPQIQAFYHSTPRHIKVQCPPLPQKVLPQIIEAYSKNGEGHRFFDRQPILLPFKLVQNNPSPNYSFLPNPVQNVVTYCLSQLLAYNIRLIIISLGLSTVKFHFLYLKLSPFFYSLDLCQSCHFFKNTLKIIVF